MRRWGWLVWSVSALTVAGCQCGGIEVEDAGFQCLQDSDCIDGYKCIQARCRVTSGADAGHDGGTDGGSKDGGSDGGTDGGICPIDAGIANCLISACAGHSCGANGKTCSGLACSCGGNGGTAQTTESLCSDGHDNDCDGKTDCDDSMCLGLSCAANGKVCGADAGCACGGNGGTTEATETSCSDGHDNDCNRLTDCADPNCTCETDCSDGVDNDSNGFTDCDDPNCLHQSCTTDGGHVCCGTSCVNLTNNAFNCGGCGLACNSGHSCTKEGLTGACTCQGANGCPSGQKCTSSLCHCQTASDCASNQSCEATTFCGY